MDHTFYLYSMAQWLDLLGEKLGSNSSQRRKNPDLTLSSDGFDKNSRLKKWTVIVNPIESTQSLGKNRSYML